MCVLSVTDFKCIYTTNELLHWPTSSQHRMLRFTWRIQGLCHSVLLWRKRRKLKKKRKKAQNIQHNEQPVNTENTLYLKCMWYMYFVLGLGVNLSIQVKLPWDSIPLFILYDTQRLGWNLAFTFNNKKIFSANGQYHRTKEVMFKFL